jgi:PAS domain S-box-containing protein
LSLPAPDEQEPGSRPGADAGSDAGNAGDSHGASDGAPEASDSRKLDLVGRVLDLLPDFFYVHDYEMRFKYANKRAAEYYGLSKEEIVGRRRVDVDPDRAQAEFFAEVCRQVMRDGAPRMSDNLPYTRPDGTPGFLRQHDYPFVNPDNGELMLMGLSRDVTAERQLEEERIRGAALEGELQVARTIQRALRPSGEFGAPGIQVAAFAEPAAYAGGDYYDWGRCADGRFMMGVGDVTGHGVGSALLASACRAYGRALAAAFGLTEVMSRLNALILQDTVEGRFVTCAMAEFDPASFRVRLTSAGHGPMFVTRRAGDRKLDEFLPQLPPLGVSSVFEVPEPDSAALAPGDGVVFVSDGVFEAMNASGEMFGLERLRSALAALRGRPADEVVHRLMSTVREHLGGTMHQDDLTVLVATRG